MLERGANPNTLNYEGAPAILLAAQSGDAGTVRALLEAGADPNVLVRKTRRRWVTPLEIAATHGHVDCMAVLLDGGVPVNGFRLGGRRALHLAALCSEVTAVAWLLDHGADPSQRELSIAWFRWISKTPGMIAAWVGNVRILELLEAAGARFGEVYWHRTGRYTALGLARYYKQEDAVRFLESRVV